MNRTEVKLHRIIQALESQKKSTTLEVIPLLLEMFDSEPEKLNRLLMEPEDRAKLDGQLHQRSEIFSSGVGVTFAACSDFSKPIAMRTLHPYAKRKAQEHSASRWFMFLTNLDTPGSVDFSCADYDWQSTQIAQETDETSACSSLEEKLTRYHGEVFFPEFSFSRNQFKPTPQKELEFADQVVYFGTDLFVFQLKERNADSIEDLASEQKWFDNKVIKKGSSQLRDTIRFLREHSMIKLTNQKGRTLDLASAPRRTVCQVLIYDTPKPELISTRPSHRISRTTGDFIHIFPASTYKLICGWLHTPTEIASYLEFRENALKRKPVVTEEALLGQFFTAEQNAEPDENFANALTTMLQDEDAYDIRQIIIDFQSKIEPGDEDPFDYYKILTELAKLSRGSLRLFKERFSLALRSTLDGESKRPTRFYTKECGFIFVTAPLGFSPEIYKERLLDLTVMAKYDGKIDKEVGVCFAREGEHILIFWSYLEGVWEEDKDVEDDIKSLGSFFRPTKEKWVHEYFHEDLEE